MQSAISGASSNTILHMQHMAKAFPGVRALDDVELSVSAGEVHAVVGENGAGKSTLMKILAGVYRPDAGVILLDGHSVAVHSPSDSIALGIAVIYQEVPLVPTLTVLANVYLGREIIGALGVVKNRSQREQYLDLCQRVGIFVDPDVMARDLTRSQAQLVEILKALDRDARIIVMDEPTAALDQEGKQALFAAVRQLQSRGTTFIFISHFIDEVFELADRVTILRDGHNVSTLLRSETSPTELIALMVGHAAQTAARPSARTYDGEVMLEARNISLSPRLHDVSLQLRRGEILGLAGLVGSGRTELALTLFGHVPPSQGEIYVRGNLVHLRSPHDAISTGICLLPEDRKRRGLILGFEVFKNLSLSSLQRFSPRFVLRFADERRFAQHYIDELRINTPSPEQRAIFLSGGNQQKVVLGRMLATDAAILLFDEPTQGIDVGAKEQIFRLMRRLADDGKAILFISSELKEVADVSDRCLVLKNGRIVRELDHTEISEARLKQLAILGEAKGGTS